jgi:hypothetical protein
MDFHGFTHVFGLLFNAALILRVLTMGIVRRRLLWRSALKACAAIAPLLALLPTLALGDVTVNGTVSLQNSVDGGVAAPVEMRDQDGDRLRFVDHRVDTGRDVPLFTDRFVGSAVAAHNKWAQSILTQTATVGSGAITLNASAITTINTYSDLMTVPKFRGYADGALYMHARARPVNLPQTNALAELGFGNVLTTAAPTDGAFFRWTASGGFECVNNRGGAETSTSMTTPTANIYSYFAIEVWGDKQVCRYSTPSTGFEEEVILTLASGAPSAFNESPSGLMRIVNGASAPALAPQLIVGLYEVSIKVIDIDRPSQTTAAISGLSSAYLPTTGAQSTNHANSTSPASAALSNTAAGYATLGGRYQFAAPVGAATDFALFGYQVPASFRLIVTGVRISACNTGAAVATTATMLDWGIAIDSTAVSLATVDAIAAAPTTAPRRQPLGTQAFIVGAGIGVCAESITVPFMSPITVESGRFFHVVVQVPIGTATASQVIRGDVFVDAHWEQ